MNLVSEHVNGLKLFRFLRMLGKVGDVSKVGLRLILELVELGLPNVGRTGGCVWRVAGRELLVSIWEADS